MSEVYKAISAVQSELAKVGISKDGVNQQQRYKFRGIDQVYATLSPLLAKNALCVLPRMVEVQRTEGKTQKGYPLFYTVVTAEFDFVSSKDGSIHTIRTYGEAMDSADKATNKAMSAAYKYAAFMAFGIPTEGQDDADETTPEPAQSTPSGMPDHEYGKLMTLAKAAGITAAQLAKRYGVKDARLLSQDHYADAMRGMMEVVDKKKKEETNSAASGEFDGIDNIDF